jgi:hypothetical protein
MSAGDQFVLLRVGDQATNPVELEVSELPQIVEGSAANNVPAEAQAISLPCGVNGRLEAESDVDCFAFPAKSGESFNFDILARRNWSAVDSVMRIMNSGAVQAESDDFARWGKRNMQDSCLEGWKAPADGTYVVEIRDVHARGGAAYPYLLHVTPGVPDLELLIDTDKTWVTPGTCAPIFVRARRINGFDGPVELQIDGLPGGVTAHCGRILPGGQDGCIILEASADAAISATNATISGRFTTNAGDAQVRAATPFQETYIPGGGRNHVPVAMHTVGVGRAADIRDVSLSTYDLRLKPGESQRIDVTLTRTEGFAQNVTLDVLFQHLGRIYADPLPTGVSLDAKNSTTLLSGGETNGYVTLKADATAKSVEAQQCCLMANVSINFVMKATYASRPLKISIDAP